MDQPVPESVPREPLERLRCVFDTLDSADINYAVLRDYDRLFTLTAEKEIDLIASPGGFLRAAEVLEGLGFVEVPAWGRDPHRFLVAYFDDFDLWLKLDFVTAIRFGKPISACEMDLLDEVLERRVRRELGYSLAPEDEFVILMLKSIINDRGFSETRSETLRGLWLEIETHAVSLSNLSNVFEKQLHGLVCLEHARSVAAGDCRALMAKRQELLSVIAARTRIQTMRRYLKTFAAAKMNGILHAVFDRGVSVALLAPDGAGKSTLAAALVRQRHLNSRVIYMGMNVTAGNVRLPTSAWLRRQVKKRDRSALSKLIVRLFNFPNALLEQWLRSGVGAWHKLRGRLVVFDRYIYDAWIEAPPVNLRKRLRKFFVDRTCPVPDIVLLLDAPGDMLFARKGEHSPQSLEDKRQRYLQLAKVLDNMVVIDATRGARAVRVEVTSLLWQRRTRGISRRKPNQARAGVK